MPEGITCLAHLPQATVGYRKASHASPTQLIFDPITSLRLASNTLHQFCNSDAIGGHYCIKKELDAIVIHVDAIGMIYRIDFEQEMQYVETIASDKFGCITIDFLCNM